MHQQPGPVAGWFPSLGLAGVYEPAMWAGGLTGVFPVFNSQ